MNDAQPTAEAVAVKDGKILAVGSRADIEKAHKSAATQFVDLVILDKNPFTVDPTRFFSIRHGHGPTVKMTCAF